MRGLKALFSYILTKTPSKKRKTIDKNYKVRYSLRRPPALLPAKNEPEKGAWR